MKEEKEDKRGQLHTRRAAAFLFLGVVAFFCILNLATKNYRSGTVPGKMVFTPVKTGIDILLGQRKSDGILLGDGDYLLEEIEAPDEKELTEKLEAIERFRKSYPTVNFYFMLVPNAANVLEEMLPSGAAMEDQAEQFKKIQERLASGITWVDVQAVLKKNKGESIYYHTDSRWTTLGAYYGYQELAAAMGLDTSLSPEFDVYPVTGNFRGDLVERSGYRRSYGEPIYVYSMKEGQGPEFVISYPEEERRTGTLYDSSKLDGNNNMYNVFLGGDSPVIEIQTTVESTDRLLVVKDSYANCLIPFLLPYYREIVVIDPALYTGDIYQVMEEKKITRVLFLYSGNTFMRDGHISGVLADGKTE